jgi:hypothetical protein
MELGYIDEYTNRDQWCHSFMINQGFSLGDNMIFGIIYVLVLLWIFQGIGIVSDLFMDAIEVITS